MNPLPFENVTIMTTQKSQSVVRLPIDVYNYAVYLSSISRQSITEILGNALRYAFGNVSFIAADVYDITFTGDGEPVKGG